MEFQRVSKPLISELSRIVSWTSSQSVVYQECLQILFDETFHMITWVLSIITDGIAMEGAIIDALTAHILAISLTYVTELTVNEFVQHDNTH